LLACLLINRGIDSSEKAAVFLSPSLRNGLRTPLLFPDMARATERILQARTRRERVCIYGDYDVDGVTGSSQLLLFLRELGMSPDLYIPHRTREGYGLNAQACGRLLNAIPVMITGLRGATCACRKSLWRSIGVDVIVCDHHHVPEQRPPAYAVLNPMEKAVSVFVLWPVWGGCGVSIC
jgi:single-stranded-DNA-specific exonuclease